MDGSPIWLNAAFVVTIEPQHKKDGSLVVPIGDGLDYEVRESPESVLAMLENAPVPAVIPVPSTDALSVAPTDEAEAAECAVPDASAEESPNPAKKASAKRVRAKSEKKEEDGDNDPSTARKKSPAKGKTRKKAALKLDDQQLERLRKLAPKTAKKLLNTISTQFKVDDAAKTVEALKSNGVIEMEGERVSWTDPS